MFLFILSLPSSSWKWKARCSLPTRTSLHVCSMPRKSCVDLLFEKERKILFRCKGGNVEHIHKCIYRLHITLLHAATGSCRTWFCRSIVLLCLVVFCCLCAFLSSCTRAGVRYRTSRRATSRSASSGNHCVDCYHSTRKSALHLRI